MKNTLIYTALFSFVITFIFVVPLSFINKATSPLVIQNQQIAASYVILKTLGISGVEKNQKAVEDVMKLKMMSAKTKQIVEYKDFAELNDNLSDTIFIANINGEDVYAKSFAGPGLWGIINAMIAFNKDITKLKGFQVISHSETPGLGTKVTEDWYTNQFVDQVIGPKDSKTGLYLQFITGNGLGDSDKNNYTIDSITGATRTVEGVKVIVNNSIDEMKEIMGGK